MKRLVFALVTVSVVFCQALFAEEIGTVTYVEGRVDLARAGSETATPLMQGEMVSIGDALRTKSNSKAEITFKDETSVRLASNTRIEIRDYKLDKNNKRLTATILLDRGKARAIIAKMPDAAEFNIDTPNTNGTVKGSDIFAFYQAGNTGMLVREGRLSVNNIALPDEKILIPAGNSVVVPLEESPKGPRPYFELEKKLLEQDTEVPRSISRKEKDAIIKGVVNNLSGDVKITPSGESLPHAARLNEIVGEGDKIQTGPDGMIEIRLDNGNALNLKPDSELVIVKMRIDPATGEYENLFTSRMGKIKARIEGLKGKSRFEVRSPTAISGARGTIMYLEIMPNLTKSFFEGGKGYISSVLSGITKVIDAGQNSRADAGGSVADSTYTTDSDRMNISEGWTPGNGVEGYSSPEGGNVYMFASNMGTDQGIGIDQMSGYEPGGGFFSDVPFAQSHPAAPAAPDEEDVTTPVNTVFDINLNGRFGNVDNGDEGIIFEQIEGSLLSGAISANVDMPLKWSGIFPAVISGTTSSTESSDFGRGIVSGSTNEGGSILGWMGGTGFSDLWGGAFSALYIDPSGMAGALFGLFSGTTTGDTNSLFSGNGDIFILPMENAGILAADLAKEGSTVTSSGSGSFSASFFGDGYMDASFTREAMSLRGTTWGIWQDLYAGNYYNPGSSDWSSAAGGRYNTDGYFINAFEGIDNLEGVFSADIMSTYLDYTTFGYYAGTFFGKYAFYDYEHEGNNFEGVGFGTWLELPLAWSGKIDAFYHYYDSERNRVKYDRADSNIGIIGAIASPFETPGLPVGSVIMGEAIPGGHKTWWGYLHGLDFARDKTVLPDGFIGGTINSSGDSLDGILACLYVDDSGNAGTLLGDFVGEYFSSIDMWLANGSMTATRRATGHTDYDYDSNSIKGYLNGSFENGGAIYNNANIYNISHGHLTSYTSNLRNLSTLWGVYNMELGGYFNGRNDNWTMAMAGDSWAAKGGNHDYWLATVTGTKWSDGVIKGGLDGIWLAEAGDGMVKIGTITGKLIGDYIDIPETGTWTAISAGEWVEVSDLLDEHAMFGSQGLRMLDNLVNVPITERLSLSGAGTFNGIGSISAVADMNIYASQSFWTLVLNDGKYTPPPSGMATTPWTLTFNNTEVSFTCTGTKWDGNDWVADVTGIYDGKNLLGQVGGKYTDPGSDGTGSFDGAGAGRIMDPVSPPNP